MANIQYYWDYVTNACGNEIGAAGLLGNIQAESGIIPYRKQGDFTSGYTKSLKYTSDVDLGIISEYQFVHDSIGYGLAQWTFYSRKQNYYDWCNNRGGSIGSASNGVSFLIDELQNSYPSVWDAMVNANNLKTVSNIVLHQFENPAKQDATVENYRYNLSFAIYNEYATGVIPPSPDPPEPEPGTNNYAHIICLLYDEDDN